MALNKGEQVKVLDHGYVKLIDWLGGDETIIEAARMSTNKGFISWDQYFECPQCGFTWIHSDPPATKHQCPGKLTIKPTGDYGLLEYLWKNSHATPFEMCELVLEVQAPIMVFREWHRHRMQSYNEMSARYTQMPNLHYVPDRKRLIAQATKNKQAASVGDKEFEDLDEALRFIGEEQDSIYQHYEEMLTHGVPKEVARINCPVSRYSKMRAKTDLRNWLAFLNLRARESAQWEIRQYANVVGDFISELFPRTYGIFEEYTLYAETFSRNETKLLKQLFQALEGAAPGAAAMLMKDQKTGTTSKFGKSLLEKLKKETA